MEKRYIVVYGEKGKESFNINAINMVAKDCKVLIGIVKKHIEDLVKKLNELDGSGFYVGFYILPNEKSNNDYIVEYYIQEMRTQTIYAKFKIVEIDF